MRSTLRTLGVLVVLGLVVPPRGARSEEPLTLEKAFRLAVERNLELRAAREGRYQAWLYRPKAWTLVTPRLSVSGARIWEKEIEVPLGGGLGGIPTGALSAFTPAQEVQLDTMLSRFGQGQPILIQPTAQNQFQVNGSWTLFSGEFWPRLKQSWSLDRAGAEDERRALAETLFGVAGSYYRTLEADRVEQIALEAVRLAEAHIRDAQARVRVGAETRGALLQAQLDGKRSERQEVEARGALELARVNLGLSLGLRDLPPLSDPPSPAPPTEGVEDLLRQALDRRPERIRAAEDLRFAEEERSAAHGRFLPNLVAEGNFTHTDPPAGLSEPDNWRAMLVLTVPVFQGGGEYLDAMEGASKARAARAREELVAQQIEEEIRRGVADLKSSTEALAAAQAAVVLARENYDLARRSFEVGSATSNQVTDARYALSAAETDLVRETYHRALGILELDKAAGTFLDRWMPSSAVAGGEEAP